MLCLVADSLLLLAVVRVEVWATPSCLVAYFWKDAGFDWRATYAKWRSREYWLFLLPSSLLSVWIVWLPAVSIIYALPSSLQIPLFCIVCCFWSILLQLIAKTGTDANDSLLAAQQHEGEGHTQRDTHSALDTRDENDDEAEEEEQTDDGRTGGEDEDEDENEEASSSGGRIEERSGGEADSPAGVRSADRALR